MNISYSNPNPNPKTYRKYVIKPHLSQFGFSKMMKYRIGSIENRVGMVPILTTRLEGVM